MKRTVQAGVSAARVASNRVPSGGGHHAHFSRLSSQVVNGGGVRGCLGCDVGECGVGWPVMVQQSSLMGTYECSVDNRYRIAIPAKHRHAFDRGVVVSRWLDECLVIVPRDHWQVLLQDVFGDLDVRNDRQRWLRRYLMAGAYDMDGLDKQGRVVIPPELRDHIDLEVRVKLMGNGDYFELWNPALIEPKFGEMEREGVSKYGNGRDDIEQ